MKILISADMEGISSVIHWDEVVPDRPDYVRFRKLMTEDVNAAVAGACDGGADAVIVTDGHSRGRNILVEELDSRAEICRGLTGPLVQVAGVDTGVDGAFLIGYHARAGTPRAILDHTWSAEMVANIWLNEHLVGETGLSAGVCGQYGVPILMVSGDRAVCTEAVQLLGEIETAVVKHATGMMSARCLAPSVAQERIYQAAQRGVRRLSVGEAVSPFQLAAPITLVIEFARSEMADGAEALPGADRNGKSISFVADDMVTVQKAMCAALALAR